MRLEDLPRIARRAANIAMTPPSGPVFIAIPSLKIQEKLAPTRQLPQMSLGTEWRPRRVL
jgi:thiamine pyrophosphate-dependent acetolactate synthase large subunit-like protein